MSTDQALAEIQSVEATREVLAGPVILGAGSQTVFEAESVSALPRAKAYKLMQMPLTGTLSVEGQVLPEGAVVDFAKFRSLKFEPSTNFLALAGDNTSVVDLPSVIVETAAIAGDGAAVPVQLKIRQTVHQCDLLAAEPLDLQGVGKGLELEEIDGANAMIACQKAVSDYPDSMRYMYLLGRVHLAAGNVDSAVALIQQAADAGYIRAFNQ